MGTYSGCEVDGRDNTHTFMPPKSVAYSRASAAKYYKSAKSRADTARASVFAARRPMRSVAKAEVKNIDTVPATGTFATATGTLTFLNGTTQGAAATNRLGRQFKMVSLLVRGTIQMAPTTTGSSGFRLIVFYDKQVNGAAPTAAQLLATDSIDGLMNLDNSRRFKILCDEQRDCIGTAGPQALSFNIYRKMNLQTECNTGSTGNVGDIQTGSVYALTYSNANTGVAAATSNLRARIRFVD